MIRIDHVVYAVRDLDRAAERFRDELGLGSVARGRHAGWGTGNRIVRVSDGDPAVTAFAVATAGGEMVVT